jgi:phage terminase small subunit
MDNLPILDEDFHVSGLSPKQERFCYLVSQGLNATDAYRQAKYKVKTDGAAWTNASRLLSNAKVKAFIKYLRDKAVEKSIADLVEVKQGLTEIFRGRMGDYISINENGNVAVSPTDKALKSAAVQELTTESVNLGSKDAPLEATITKIKLRDPIPAARLLSELSGWAKPEGAVNVNVNNINTVEARIAVFDPKEVASAIIEAERLGLPASVFGEVVNCESSPVLPPPANGKTTTLPKPE